MTAIAPVQIAFPSGLYDTSPSWVDVAGVDAWDTYRGRSYELSGPKQAPGPPP